MIWAKVKLYVAAGFAALLAVLSGYIMYLRERRAVVQRDLAEGEAKAIKRAIDKQKDSQELTSEQLEEADDRHRNGEFRDID